MSISIQGTSTSAGSPAPATSGSDEQRAYAAATKDLRDAQQQLSKDTAAKAGDDTLKADQLAVQLAQAAVATAAAALAKANAEAQQKRADAKAPPTTAPSSRRDDGVDVYA